MQHLAPDSSATPLKHIVVCGAGLAAQMTVAALSQQAPSRMRVTWLKIAGTGTKDVLYGGVATPTAYDFNLAAGLDEPQLVLDSNTAFSFGTHYSNWGAGHRDWLQAFHAPFPVVDGVLFYHYLLQRGIGDMTPYLVSAEAARRGVFAHPPEDQRHPLSRAEYGYQFDAASYGALFERRITPAVTTVSGTILEVMREGDGIGSLRLADGQSLAADLYIDCSGPDAHLAAHLGAAVTPSARLGVLASQTAAADLGAPVRTVKAGAFGWSAITPVQNASLRLTVYAREDEDMALDAHGEAPSLAGDFTPGYRAAAWTGNCVAIGHAAGVIEPLTPAPFILLQRDIDRLLSLVPNSHDMAVERREFNRQYLDDYRHAGLFNRALFNPQDASGGAYWERAATAPLDERLASKIEQFESRGLHVAFDLEPFGLEDWITLHFGMGRRPVRHDRIADHSARDKVDQYLNRMRGDIAQAVASMPPHGVYRQGLTKYLKQQGSLAS